MDRKNTPENYRGSLPAAYDRRTNPRPSILTTDEYRAQFAATIRTIRANFIANAYNKDTTK